MSSKQSAHELIFGKMHSHILENKRIKDPKELVRLAKGVSNHRRIEIIFLLTKRKSLTMEEISTTLNCNFKTISGHTQKLVQAGLIEKKYLAQNVLHTLTPRGKRFYEFLISQ
jgi:predicted transcriptional regulator